MCSLKLIIENVKHSDPLGIIPLIFTSEYFVFINYQIRKFIDSSPLTFNAKFIEFHYFPIHNYCKNKNICSRNLIHICIYKQKQGNSDNTKNFIHKYS